MKIDTNNWKVFCVGDLFNEIYKVTSYDDGDLEMCAACAEDAIPYVTRTDMNNGVKSFVHGASLVNVEEGNAIVIGDTTATISYQPKSFVAGEHIIAARAIWMNERTGLFITCLLRQERYKYSYGRAYKIDLIKNTEIRLPATKAGNPDWHWMESYIDSLHSKPLTTKNSVKHASHTLNIIGWNEFRIDELFDVVYGVNLEFVNCVETNETDSEAIAFVSRTESNNGVSGYVKPVRGITPQPKGTITVAGGGSVLAAFLQPRPFYSGRDLYLLYPKNNISNEAKLFIITIIKANKYRYNYGRQANVTLPSLRLRLPSTAEGKPDWQWMEDYIKSLPYGDRLPVDE